MSNRSASRRTTDVVRGFVAPITLAALSVGLVWGTWRFFVQSPTGQLIDDAAWQGSGYRRESLEGFVAPVVQVISEPFLVIAAVTAFVVAAVQRRWSIAIAATVLLAGANVTTQLLKEVLLTRPDFDLTARPVNTLPSGHTTAAFAVAATALLIAPARWRGPVAVIGALYAGATGIGTLVLGWHRPSDVVAAFAVVAAWYFAFEAARGIRLKPLPRGYGEAPAGNASVWLWSLAGIGLAIAFVGLVLTFTQVPGVEGRAETFAYVTSAAGIAGTSALTMATMLGMRPYYALDEPGP